MMHLVQGNISNQQLIKGAVCAGLAFGGVALISKVGLNALSTHLPGAYTLSQNVIPFTTGVYISCIAISYVAIKCLKPYLAPLMGMIGGGTPITDTLGPALQRLGDVKKGEDTDPSQTLIASMEKLGMDTVPVQNIRNVILRITKLYKEAYPDVDTSHFMQVMFKYVTWNKSEKESLIEVKIPSISKELRIDQNELMTLVQKANANLFQGSSMTTEQREARLQEIALKCERKLLLHLLDFLDALPPLETPEGKQQTLTRSKKRVRTHKQQKAKKKRTVRIKLLARNELRAELARTIKQYKKALEARDQDVSKIDDLEQMFLGQKDAPTDLNALRQVLQARGIDTSDLQEVERLLTGLQQINTTTNSVYKELEKHGISKEVYQRTLHMISKEGEPVPVEQLANTLNIDASVLAKILGSSGTKVTIPNIFALIESDTPPLTYFSALEKVDTEMLSSLINSKSNSKNSEGFTPLCYAIDREKFEWIPILLHFGADVHKASLSKGNSLFPIHLAVAKGVVSVVQKLVNAGANPLQKDSKKRTPVTLVGLRYKAIDKSEMASTTKNVLKGRYQEITSLLVEALKQHTCLREEAKKKSQAIDIFALINSEDNPATHLAKLQAYYTSNKEQLEVPQENGPTPLGAAIKAGNPEWVKVLLECGANPNTNIAKSGTTPLHYAVMCLSVPMVKLLLSAGADKSALDPNSQETPEALLRRMQTKAQNSTSVGNESVKDGVKECEAILALLEKAPSVSTSSPESSEKKQ